MTVSGFSNEGILCALLSEATTNQATLTLREKILAGFGFPPTAQFWLVDKSLSKTEIQGSVGQWFCNNTWTNPATTSPPTCGPDGPAPPRGSAMADVLIYVK